METADGYSAKGMEREEARVEDPVTWECALENPEETRDRVIGIVGRKRQEGNQWGDVAVWQTRSSACCW